MFDCMLSLAVVFQQTLLPPDRLAAKDSERTPIVRTTQKRRAAIWSHLKILLTPPPMQVLAAPMALCIMANDGKGKR